MVETVKNSLVSNDILITGEHFRGKSNQDVKYFFIDNQPLEAFPRNLQEKLPKLKHLFIRGCGLKKISKADLVGLENLEWLCLSGNYLTSLPDDLLDDMKKLRQIHFDNNKLERLSSKLLKHYNGRFHRLEIANFQGNTKIDDVFTGIKSVYQKPVTLKRLKEVMDSLEPPLPETDQQIE